MENNNLQHKRDLEQLKEILKKLSDEDWKEIMILKNNLLNRFKVESEGGNFIVPLKINVTFEKKSTPISDDQAIDEYAEEYMKSMEDKCGEKDVRNKEIENKPKQLSNNEAIAKNIDEYKKFLQNKEDEKVATIECFQGNTFVITKEGIKQVENLNVGNEIETSNGTSKIIEIPKLFDFKNLKVGTKVYHIQDGFINGYYFVGTHPKANNCIMMISDVNHSKIEVFNLRYNNSFTLDYEEAKEIMWLQLKEQIKSVNEIYFGGKKLI